MPPYTKGTGSRQADSTRSRRVVKQHSYRENPPSPADSDDGQNKMLLRRWLICEVEAANVPGMRWVNKEKTQVKIPWTHGSRHEFDAGKDSCLFRRWAIHTGETLT